MVQRKIVNENTHIIMTLPNQLVLDQLVLLCRPGFEKECAAEAMELASKHKFSAYIKTQPDSGYVLLVGTQGQDALELINQCPFSNLIFTRQWFASNTQTVNLPEGDRVSHLIRHIKQLNSPLSDITLGDIELSYPDTNEGKSLNRFCKQFRPHLVTALNKHGLLRQHAEHTLHLLLLDSHTLWTGVSLSDNQSIYAAGIARLRMPSSAPSRSTLKLDEAIQWFLDEHQQQKLFKPGMTAVDLGAAPGGWSWQLVKRGLQVTAIDNGNIDPSLMASGMVEHYRVDAFKYQPRHRADWLVCDMVETPARVTRLVASWLTEKHCKHAIFNLKLPMKKRWQSVQDCKHALEKSLNNSGVSYRLQMKQLYHDREEITCCVTLKSS